MSNPKLDNQANMDSALSVVGEAQGRTSSAPPAVLIERAEQLLDDFAALVKKGGSRSELVVWLAAALASSSARVSTEKDQRYVAW